MEIRNTSHVSFLFRYQSRSVYPVNNAYQPEEAESITHRALYFMCARCAQQRICRKILSSTPRSARTESCYCNRRRRSDN